VRQQSRLIGLLLVCLHVPLKLLGLAITNLHRPDCIRIRLLEFDGPIPNIFPVHLLPCFQKVFRICESNKAILRLDNLSVDTAINSYSPTDLSTETVANDLRLLEGRILVKGVGQYIVRDIIA